jgi:hypothetical protein
MKRLGGLIAMVVSMLGCAVEAQPSLDEQPSAAPAKGVRVTDPAPAASPSCATSSHRDVRLGRDVEPILMSRCSGEFCHGLTMTSASRAYAFLVNQESVECDDSRALVVPGDIEHSYVVDKMLGRHLCAGHRMPRGLGNRLSPEEVSTVTDWICEGAPND